MNSSVKRELIRELKKIYNNKDFVCGVISNTGYEHAWGVMLDFIRTARERGDEITSDNLLLLSLALREEEEEKKTIHQRRRATAAML